MYRRGGGQGRPSCGGRLAGLEAGEDGRRRWGARRGDVVRVVRVVPERRLRRAAVLRFVIGVHVAVTGRWYRYAVTGLGLPWPVVGVSIKNKYKRVRPKLIRPAYSGVEEF